MVLCMSQLNLWARAYHRILKLSRTIAALAGSELVHCFAPRVFSGDASVQAERDAQHHVMGWHIMG